MIATLGVCVGESVDLIIVLFCLVDHILYLTWETYDGFPGATIFRLVKLFRVIRSLRAVRILRAIRLTIRSCIYGQHRANVIPTAFTDLNPLKLSVRVPGCQKLQMTA